MKKIAFDVMGNDNGVQEGVKAVLEFVKTNLDYIFILVGDKKEIKKITQVTERIKIVDCPKIIDSKKGIKFAMSDNNSMTTAINLVKDKKADVVVSQGDSGMYISLSTLLLKRIDGIKRPAFMSIFPTIYKNKKFIMMDIGANLMTTSQMLEQWAILGNVFSKEVLKINNPKIGIVNIGTEDKKGNEFQINANINLKNNKDINYIGFIETRDLLNAIVDVAIIDGYGGNLVLKTIEGTALSLFQMIKKELNSKLIYKVGGLMSKKAFRNIKDVLDHRNVGAAWLFGLNHFAIKVHGGSDKKTYLSAFDQIVNAIENDSINKVKKVFNGTN